jgi:hypothetical protein
VISGLAQIEHLQVCDGRLIPRICCDLRNLPTFVYVQKCGSCISEMSSVADPDLASGIGIKSRSESGMNILDHISERLETIIRVKILKFYAADADPGIFLTLDLGPGMETIWIRDPG